MLNVTCTCISARKDTSGHGLSQSFQGAGTSENDLTGIKKCVGEVSVRCQLELITVRVLSIFTVKNLKNWVQKVLGCTSKTKCWRTYTVKNVFPCLALGCSLMKFYRAFQIHPVYLSMYACVCVYTCVYVCMYVCTTYVRTYVCVCVCVCVYTRVG